ncbi:MAG: glutamate-1-semialdehyde 2,1-aminomutase [Myxococcaceae bacterium]
MSGSPGASERLFAQARALIPGGVSSPVRAFGHVGGTPRYIARGDGAYLWDEDGRKYLDFCLAWGPLILGHANPQVVEAVTKAAKDGLAFGTPHRLEVTLAELILSAYQPFERIRFVVSGTEAVMTAMRLARAHTGRPLILKFSGCYHGHADAMLVKAGSGVATLGLADSEGVTPTVAKDTLVAPLGDVGALEELFRVHGARLAAAFIEPLPANNGLLVQERRYLQALRAITQKHGALLVFDEVISGFRLGFHGYGLTVDVRPDLVTLGKIIGGGLPVGAVTGRAELLDRLAPAGRVYQAGTMSGNPVALAAGVACLEQLKTGEPYKRIAKAGEAMDAAFVGKKNLAFQLVRVGSVFWPYFDRSAPVPTRAEAISEDAIKGFRSRYQGWLEQGLYLSPSAYEVGFLSSAHEPAHVQQLVEALAGA